VEEFMNTPWALDPHSRWEVALTEMILPKTFQMYPDRLNPLSVTFSWNDQELQDITLSANNFYHSPNDLVENINSLMEDDKSIEITPEGEDEPIIFKLIDYLQFHYNPHTLQVFLRLKTPPPVDITLTMSDGLRELFNLEDDDEEFQIKSENHDGQIDRIVFSEMFNFDIITDYIHILLQEANMSFINNEMIPWLYSCSIGSSSVVSHSHTHITVKPVSLCYVPLNSVNSMRNKLNLSVVDKNLNLLKPHNRLYKHRKTVFHLHFRNILPGR